jgi:hypothetical protein
VVHQSQQAQARLALVERALQPVARRLVQVERERPSISVVLQLSIQVAAAAAVMALQADSADLEQVMVVEYPSQPVQMPLQIEAEVVALARHTYFLETVDPA